MGRLRRGLIILSSSVLTLLLVISMGISVFSHQANAAPVAQAATTTAMSDRNQQLLDNFSKALASRLNVDEATLNNALGQAVGDTTDQAVKDGYLNQTQATFIKEQTKNGFKGLLTQPKTAKMVAGLEQAKEMGQYLMPVVMSVSNTLNLSPMTLAAQLQADKSLAEIAQTQQVDLSKVKDAITSSIKTQLEAAVKAGKLTQEQADKANQTVGIWLDEAVTFHKSLAPAKGNTQDLAQCYTPVLNATATALNLTPAQLEEELRSGKSFGEVVKAQKADPQQIKATILSSSKTQLEVATKAGKLTSSQADKAYQTLGLWIDELFK
ncbi:MAG: hypothetical protein WCS37_04100 [Chloroflexota bacterium]|nr:hypothetical protein [Chloroflexota bacterium]